MPIKWKSLPVKEAMDKAEEQVKMGNEFLAEARKIVEEARKGENLPQYVTQRLYTLSAELGDFPKRFLDKIEGIRGELPKNALVSEGKSLALGPQGKLSME